MKNLFLSFLLILSLFYSTINAEIVRRAAFDFGSGKTKLLVADVDTDTHQIVEYLYKQKARVDLSEDLARGDERTFSEQAMEEAVEVAKKLKQKAIELGATQFYGMATEAYRKAVNGQELVDRYKQELDFSVKIVSQAEEGESGFYTLIYEIQADPSEVIVWDIGGGSFQITYLMNDGSIGTYQGPFGNSTTRSAIIAHVKKEDPREKESPNPMNASEWEQAIEYINAHLDDIPGPLMEKVKNSSVRVICLDTPPTFVNGKVYDIKDLKELAEGYFNKTDDEILSKHTIPKEAVPQLSLMYAILKKMGLEKVSYLETKCGSCSILLITEKHWQNQ